MLLASIFIYGNQKPIALFNKKIRIMFSSDQNIRSLRALIAEIKSYIGLRYELARLDLVSKFTVLLAAFFLSLVLLLLLLFALFFLSYSTAKGLADTLGNESLALLLVAGFYLLLAALLYLLRKPLIIQPIANFLGHLFLDSNKEEENKA